MSSAGASRRQWHAWLRRVAPWAITAAVIGALLYRYPLAAIAAHVQRGAWWPVVACTLAAVFGTIFAIAFSDLIVIHASLGRVRYPDIVMGRAAASLLTAVNQAASSGMYGVWMARKTGSDLRETLGAVIYIALADVAALAVLASAGVWMGGDDLPVRVYQVARVAAPAAAVGLVAHALVAPRLLRGRAGGTSFLRPWVNVSAPRYVIGLAARIAVVSTFTVACWGAAAGFGLSIPLSAMAVRLPLILIVSTLPINALGFGPVQVMWLLFDRWAPGEQILAFQVVWQLALTASMIALGAPFLRRVLGEIAGDAAPRRASEA